nr:hypothetical protein [Idiomarina piscisalsi]
MKRLHSPDSSFVEEASLPWLSCIMLEFILEVDEARGARNADSRKVSELLNDLWELQNEALQFQDDKNILLTMRPFMIQQLRFQSGQVTHLYFLSRMRLILMDYNTSPKPIQAFEKNTGIKLKDFFTLSLFFAVIFSNILEKKQSKITYEFILTKLYPSYSLDTLARFLSMVGGDFETLSKIVRSRKAHAGPARPERYFSESLLFDKPLLLLPSGISTTHSYIACIGLCEFVLRTLKSCDNSGNVFRKPFSMAFEKYINQLFIEYDLNVVPEHVLKGKYDEDMKNNKVVDFFYSTDDKNLFVDAKSVEPKQEVLSTQEPRRIKERLRDHLIGALVQAQVCASTLEQSGYENIVSRSRRYILVISHQDFFVGSGLRLRNLLGNDYGPTIDEAIGDEFELENVFYIAIAEFEGLMKLLQNSQKTIFDFLDFCKEREAEQFLFDMRQYISEFGQVLELENPSPIGSEQVQESFDFTYEDLKSVWKYSSDYWRKKGKVDPLLATNEFISVSRYFRNVLLMSK